MSKKLSREQFKYAEQRLVQIERAEWEKIQGGFYMKPPAPVLMKDLIAGIKKGKIKPQEFYASPEQEVSRALTLNDVFGLDIKDYKVRDNKAYNAAVKEHRAKWRAVGDKLFLGDAEETLALIRDLEK